MKSIGTFNMLSDPMWLPLGNNGVNLSYPEYSNFPIINLNFFLVYVNEFILFKTQQMEISYV